MCISKTLSMNKLIHSPAPASRKKGAKDEEEVETGKQSNHLARKLKMRNKSHKLDQNLADQFMTGYALFVFDST